MGGGGSKVYRTYADEEAERQRREWVNQRRRERKAKEKARKNAMKKERDLWLKNNKRRLHKKWWNVPWWPLYEWWKEKTLWEQELHRRRMKNLIDSEGIPLKSHHD